MKTLKHKKTITKRSSFPYKVIGLVLYLLWVQPFGANHLYASERKINIEVNDVTLIDVLKQIEAQSDYVFFYNNADIDTEKKISINMKDANIKDVLDRILNEYSYRINNKKIIITAKRQAPVRTNKISGVVSDDSGQPIIGGNVLVKGLNKGTMTNIDGKYTIDVPDSATTLVISYIGYKKQEVEIGDRNYIPVTLQKNDVLMDEVVVIGYGTVKKSDLTGAVSSVKTENLPIAANTSVTHMLAGQAAGVMVKQNSAQPGGGIEIYVRGAASTGAGNDPLYVIDGFPVTNKSVEPESGNRYEYGSRNPMNSLNPNDIESIEILKDASATAIYGARAANGVILVTTKRGKSGKPIVKYNANYSIQTIAKRLEMLSAKEFMNVSNEISYQKWRMDNELYPYGGELEEDALPYKGNPYSPEEIAAAGEGTDWFGLLTRDGSINQHNVSVSAGTESTRFLASLNYYKQKGVIKNSDFQRISGRINLDQDLGKYVKAGINATYSTIFNNNVPLGEGNAENSSLLNSALHYDPLVPVKDESGNYALSPTLGMIPNPVSMLEITDQTQTDRLLANGYIEATFWKDLKVKLNMGIDKNQGRRSTYLPKSTLYGKQEGGKANINENRTVDLLFELTANYTKQLFKERDRLEVLLGYSYQQENWDGLGAGSSQFFTDLFLWNKLEAGNVARPPVSSSKGKNELGSYFGRINYSLLDKYLFTFSLRYDGSSKFGKNNKWGLFPSGAFAWKMQNENFLKDVDWLSELKLRVSFGQTGNSNIGGNAYEYYEAGNQYVFGDAVQTGSIKSQLENPDLKWETTTELNVGLDFGFLNNRITGSFEYFHKVVSDLLAFRKLNSLMEVSTIADNIGATQSTGYEFSLNTVNLTGPFKWNTTLNISSYNDRWKERNPDVVLAPYEKEDAPIRAIYGSVSDGILQIGETPPASMPDLLPGQMKVKDLNGFDPNDGSKLLGHPDGKIDAADRIYLGSTDPKVIIGFGNMFEYKNFDLNIFFYGMFGQYVANSNRAKYGPSGCEYILQRQNYSKEVLERWTPDNPTNKFPSGFYSAYYGGDDWLLEKVSFVRCKNITLGYSFPHKWIHKVFSQARIYVDVENPFIITNYQGLDPEMDSKGGYPSQRTYSIGIDITF